MNPALVDWLLTGPDWMQYRVQLDLLHKQTGDEQLQSARAAMVADPALTELLTLLQSWPATPLKRHNDSSQGLHKLVFLSELGFQASDPILSPVMDKILALTDDDGIPLNVFNISPRYGGTGQDQCAWMLCDAPLMVYALTLLGLSSDERLRSARKKLTSLVSDNGWPCSVSRYLGKFRGPGRKNDPCPYATLLMVQMLAANPQLDEEQTLQTGCESLLSFWQQRKEKKMYLFGIGTGFLKLKAPLIWFDLLHFLDVFSNLPFVYNDERFLEMVGILRSKQDAEERFIPQSIYMPWKGWEFGQKKIPSYWITFLAHRILQRVEI